MSALEDFLLSDGAEGQPTLLWRCINVARGSDGTLDALALYKGPLGILEEAEHIFTVLSDPATKARLAAMRAERARHAKMVHGS